MKLDHLRRDRGKNKKYLKPFIPFYRSLPPEESVRGTIPTQRVTASPNCIPAGRLTDTKARNTCGYLSKLGYHINHINSWLFGSMFFADQPIPLFEVSNISPNQKICSKTPVTSCNTAQLISLVSEAQHSSIGVPLSFTVPIRAFPIGSLGLVYVPTMNGCLMVDS